MTLGEVKHLCNLRFRHFVSINAAKPDTLLVYMQHNPGRLFARSIEKSLQNEDDKLHRGVIVIQQQDPVKRRFFRSNARLRHRANVGSIIIPGGADRRLGLIRITHKGGKTRKRHRLKIYVLT